MLGHGIFVFIRVLPVTLLLSLSQIFGAQNQPSNKVEANSKKHVKPRLTTKPTYDSWLGISPALYVSESDRTQGRIAILNLYPGGPAIKAGLKKGDYLISINGHKLKSHNDFRFIMGNLAPGVEAHVVYERENEINSLKVMVAHKPYLRDLVNQPAPILNLESYADGKVYPIPQSNQKVQVLYFMVDLFNTKFYDPFPEFKELLDIELERLDMAGKQDIVIYGITLMNCTSAKVIQKSPTDSRIDHIECEEKRLAKGESRPYEIFYDRKGQRDTLYLIETRPAIVVVDKTNVIRYADVLTEENIPKAIKAILTFK